VHGIDHLPVLWLCVTQCIFIDMEISFVEILATETVKSVVSPYMVCEAAQGVVQNISSQF